MKTLSLLLAIALLASASGQAPVSTTHIYKKAGSLEIKLDAHRVADETIRPLAVWIHGGALINGGREGIGPAGKALLEAGYCVVSIDYRLAPETKLPEIVEDLEDAFTWLRANGREKLRVNPDKIAVLGGSAGGYLTLTAGFRVKPRPTVLVAYWGYGDLVGPWMTQPSPHPAHQGARLDAAAMTAVEAGAPVANAKDREGNGGAYYQTCRQLGIWPWKVAGLDPVNAPESFVPFMAAKNVTAEFPPTLMIHGTADTDVPYEQSQIMAREFEKHRVPFQLITIEGGEHGLRGGDPAEIAAAHAAVLPFIQEHMQ